VSSQTGKDNHVIDFFYNLKLELQDIINRIINPSTLLGSISPKKRLTDCASHERHISDFMDYVKIYESKLKNTTKSKRVEIKIDHY
jgi:hypothetical protein